MIVERIDVDSKLLRVQSMMVEWQLDVDGQDKYQLRVALHHLVSQSHVTQHHHTLPDQSKYWNENIEMMNFDVATAFVIGINFPF